MPNLHIIIGDANTRKSSLLRCLTGFSNAKNLYMDVSEATGSIIRVHCTVSSLQESYKAKDPQQFINDINSITPLPNNIALILRVNKRANFPDFTAYLKAFKQAGWLIVNVALLGKNACAKASDPIFHNAVQNTISVVPNSPTQPTNLTAQQVRKDWLWA